MNDDPKKSRISSRQAKILIIIALAVATSTVTLHRVILGTILISSVRYPIPGIRDYLFHENSSFIKFIDKPFRREALGVAILRHQNGFAEYLLQDSELIQKTRPGDLSLMWYAVTTNNFEIARKLLTMGVDINDYENKVSIYPLASAVIEGKIEMAKFLIENGADLNRNTEYWSTPLELATQSGNKEMISLIEKSLSTKLSSKRDISSK